MITRMKRFNMTFCTKSTKTIKNAGAYDVPQVSPGVQLGGVSIQSYISMFQFSPVEITNKSKKLWPKFVKFL